jgi:hypothetical protein
LLLADSAIAQAIYLEMPVRLIVSRPPGSQPDIVVRLVGQRFSEFWGKPVIVQGHAWQIPDAAQQVRLSAQLRQLTAGSECLLMAGLTHSPAGRDLPDCGH